jgi:Uma2 family endonuclease
VLVPDIAGWRRERLDALPDTSWFELAPDWVCEVLSPSTARKDRVIKQAVYAREGVGFLWFIDPLARTLEAFELQSGRWMLSAALGENDHAAVAPFAAVPFELGELWA